MTIMRCLHFALTGLFSLGLAACNADVEHARVTASDPLPDASTPVATPDTPSNAENRPPRRGLRPGWWTLDEAQRALQLSPAQIEAFAKRLRNDELSYQLAQTELRQARRRQAQLLEMEDVDIEQIRALHREQLQPRSERILQINFEARLWVREQLSADQVQAALRFSPRFFRARWFRSSKGAVQEVKMGDS